MNREENTKQKEKTIMNETQNNHEKVLVSSLFFERIMNHRLFSVIFLNEKRKIIHFFHFLSYSTYFYLLLVYSPLNRHYASPSLGFKYYQRFCLISFYPFLDQNTKRESGRKVQLGNIAAAKVRPVSSPWR